jgi:precorrin-2 dehydrogenase/sirohydrochlorin ferrochelatase
VPLDEPLYPINLRIKGHRCLVVGGGRVGAQKTQGLLDCGALVTLVAPDISPEVQALAADLETGEQDATVLEIVQREYCRDDLVGKRVVVAATNDSAVNARVFADGQAVGVLVNSADDPQNCDYTLPSKVRRGPLLVTASTQGQSPALATWLRRRFQAEFGPEYELLLEVLIEAREELRASGVSTEGLGWQEALDSGMLALVREGRVAEAKERLQACLSSSLE